MDQLSKNRQQEELQVLQRSVNVLADLMDRSEIELNNADIPLPVNLIRDQVQVILNNVNNISSGLTAGQTNPSPRDLNS